jgi:VanZ family protein
MIPQKRYFLLAVTAATLIIVYGSLYPFAFSDRGSLDAAVRGLLATWRTVRSSRGDLIANVLLYMPFGFFAALSLSRRGAFVPIAVAAAAGLVLSGAIEIAQFYDAGRDSQMTDVYANTGGALLGAIAAGIVARAGRLPLIGEIERRPFVLLLLACWAGYRYYPYLPTIDLHKYWNALKPLVHAPELRVADFLRHTAIWLAVAMMLEALLGAVRSGRVFALFLVVALLLRILVLDVALSPAETAGGALALVLWGAVLSRLSFRAGLVALLFAVAVAVHALEPFAFSSAARDFGWLPFRGFLSGSLDVNATSFFEKSFLYGALLWLLIHAGWRLRVALPASVVFVFVLRYAQVYLPGRSAEIADVLILLLMGGLLALLPDHPAPGRAAERPRRD